MSNLPKLNNREMRRLEEIAKGKFPSWTVCRGTNESLRSKGLIDKIVVRPVRSGKMNCANLTDLGKQVLAGFPS